MNSLLPASVYIVPVKYNVSTGLSSVPCKLVKLKSTVLELSVQVAAVGILYVFNCIDVYEFKNILVLKPSDAV